MVGEPLPGNIPIFPLPGAILLPGARLPLNIFEPRYLKMVTDCFASGRIIGMIQPHDRAKEIPGNPVPGDAALYEVGTAGRVSSFEESDDGRFLISLSGISRFRLRQSLESPFGYRRAEVDYTPFPHDLSGDDSRLDDRDGLIQATDAFFAFKGISADWSEVKDAEDEVLATSLAMLLPFPVNEKQALLECAGTQARGAMLTTIMAMAIHEASADNDDIEPN